VSLRRTDQAVAAALTAVALLVIASWCIWQALLAGRLIDIETAEPIAIDFKIDVNKADWAEIAVMPDVGEQLAKRIVADRGEKGPFRDHEELNRVRGIGPKTLESMRPYLLPIHDVGATAGTTVNAGQPGNVN
jgi:competence protein ComEA